MIFPPSLNVNDSAKWQEGGKLRRIFPGDDCGDGGDAWGDIVRT